MPEFVGMSRSWDWCIQRLTAGQGRPDPPERATMPSMAQLFLLLTGALAVGAIVFGVAALITGGDGLGEVEPDGRSVPLPSVRPLLEADLDSVCFDTVLRGYRMAQVDQTLRRAAYDIGYKAELINVLEAEIEALRSGRTADADALRATRLAAMGDELGDELGDDPIDGVSASSDDPVIAAESIPDGLVSLEKPAAQPTSVSVDQLTESSDGQVASSHP